MRLFEQHHCKQNVSSKLPTKFRDVNYKARNDDFRLTCIFIWKYFVLILYMSWKLILIMQESFTSLLFNYRAGLREMSKMSEWLCSKLVVSSKKFYCEIYTKTITQLVVVFYILNYIQLACAWARCLIFFW